MIPAVRALRVIQVRDRVRAAVGPLLDKDDVLGAVRRAHAELDGEISRVMERPADCTAGCSHCCHVHVDATHAEVLAVARHIDETRTDAERAALVDHLAARVHTTAAMDHDARWNARVPCALLGADGKCTVYEARPLRCRAFHSFSVQRCRDAFAGSTDEPPITDATVDRTGDAVELGFDCALEEHGLSSKPVLLEQALLAMLDRGA